MKNKYILIIILIIIFIYLLFNQKKSEITEFKRRINYTNNFSIILNPDKITNFPFYINQSLEHPKLEDNHQYRGNYSLGKLYWNNEMNINISKIKEEIKHFNEIKISFENKTDFIKRENPKISLILTLHNQQKYIKTVYTSIQIQELKDIEIIFVDDDSNDNTSLIIYDLMKNDKRISYLKNDKNRRAFYSRNRGILESKGEYILVIDPDDILVNNILIKAYETAKKYDLDIVQFYAIYGYFDSPTDILWQMKYKDGILKNNSEIKNNFYNTISRNLWDKLVKREIYIKSIEFMRKEFYNELYFLNNDDTSFFGVLHFANSYGFLEQIGYFYVWKPKGSYHYRTDPKNMNMIFRSVFNNMKYFYIQSDNTNLEKSNLAYKYFYKNFNNLVKYLPYVTEGFDFILNVLDLYLNSSFFSKSQLKNINDYKLKVIDRKKKKYNNPKL